MGQDKDERQCKHCGFQKAFSDLAKHVATKSGNPFSFIAAFSIILLWAITGPFFKFNDTWQLVINTSTNYRHIPDGVSHPEYSK
ncbi:hypothetical protein BH10CYA1_BH10CYA1_33920 [soil metagenome]